VGDAASQGETMDKLIESLFDYIELIVMGALTLVMLAFLLSVFHPIKQRLAEYAKWMGAFWFSGLRNLKSVEYLKIGVLIGLLYYAGVFTTVASYWFLEPVRFDIQSRVFATPSPGATPEQACIGESASDSPIVGAIPMLLTSPFNFGPDHEPHSLTRQSNSAYLEAETRVDEQSSKDKPLRELLEDDLKFIRLVRGTVWIAFWAIAISLIKLAFIRGTQWRWLGQLNDITYRNWIDEAHQPLALQGQPNATRTETEAAQERIRRQGFAWQHAYFPLIWILVISSIVFIAALGCYRTSEFEYVELVCFGSHHAAPNTVSPQPETQP
jgi:hypothetical protein